MFIINSINAVIYIKMHDQGHVPLHVLVSKWYHLGNDTS